MAHIATNSAIADAEIEITPEMVETGATVTASYDRRFSCPEGACATGGEQRAQGRLTPCRAASLKFYAVKPISTHSTPPNGLVLMYGDGRRPIRCGPSSRTKIGRFGEAPASYKAR
jgi:hypothetical protein